MGPTMQCLICIVLISCVIAKPLTSPVPTTSTLSSTTQEASKAPSSLSTEQSVVTEISHHESKTPIIEQKELNPPTETKKEPEQPEMPKDVPEEEAEIDGEMLTSPQAFMPPFGMDGTIPDDMEGDRMIPVAMEESEPQGGMVPFEIRPRFDDEPVPVPSEIMPEEMPEDDQQKPENLPYPPQERPMDGSPPSLILPQQNSETMQIPEEINQSEEGFQKPEQETEQKEPEEQPEPEPISAEVPIYNDRLPSDPQSSEAMMPPDSEPEDEKERMPPVINKQLSDYLTNIRGAMKEYDEEDLRTWGEKSNMVGNDFSLDQFYKI